MEFVMLLVGIVIGIFGTWITMAFIDKKGRAKAKAYELRNFLRTIDDRIENAVEDAKDRLIKSKENAEARLEKIEKKLGV